MIDKSKAVCFSGHRLIEKDFDAVKLYNVIENYINKGMTYFLCGMALGFDTLVFKTLEKLRKNHDIKIIACVPCRNQSEKYNFLQKKEYDRMISVADEVIVLNEKYTVYCMMQRNKYMVDNSSYLIVYYRNLKGGTYNTLKYALEQDINIEYV